MKQGAQSSARKERKGAYFLAKAALVLKYSVNIVSRDLASITGALEGKL